MRNATRGTLGTLLLFASTWASAQDGYFNTAVIPIAVDSTVFKQEFTFDAGFDDTTIQVKFFPGQGTPQAAIGPVVCNDVHVAAFDGTVFGSLRDLCPDLAPESVFGFLSLQAKPSSDGAYKHLPMFAARTRASNAAGAGINVEAVAAATFSSGWTRVTGLRRSQAWAEYPAYQSNCFVANLNQLEPGGDPATKRVTFRLSYATSGQITFFPQPDFYGSVDVAPGQMVRLLDVFAAANAPAFDYSDYMIDFKPTTPSSNRAGLMTFCTVQDNTSYQADLRLGKIMLGVYGRSAEELMNARDQYWNEDVLHRPFEIPAGAAGNTHLVYFRAPDRVKCELLSATYGSTPDPPERLTPAAGLELRMLDSQGLVIAGGSGTTTTGEIFLGERGAITSARMDGRYLVEVESNGQNTAAVRPYSLYCTSGSGNSGGLDLIRYQEAVDRF